MRGVGGGSSSPMGVWGRGLQGGPSPIGGSGGSSPLRYRIKEKQGWISP